VNVASRDVLRGFSEMEVPVASSGDACRLFTLAPAAAPPRPALLLVHSAFGIGEHLRSVALQFVDHGYLAAVPDLYCNDADFLKHSRRDIDAAAHLSAEELSALDAAERERVAAAGAWMAGRKSHLFPPYVKACFEALRKNRDVARIGCLGYCMGGRVAGGLAAEGVDLSAAVVFYGAPPPLESVQRIRCPIEGHYAAKDPGITDKVPAFEAAMKDAGKEFTAYSYDAPHGFASTERFLLQYAGEARQAMTRAEAFLKMHLKPKPR
jgi:carboxymethylenebutenolidase